MLARICIVLFFEFECSPIAGSEPAEKYGGAFATCWIDGDIESEAEVLAREMLRVAGWKVEVIDEVYPINRDGEGGSAIWLESFYEAEKYGYCIRVNTYPPEDQEHDAG